jgi:hypothetical protein
MRLYHLAAVTAAVALAASGCDPLGSGNPTSAGTDSAGGVQVSVAAPGDFDFIGTSTAGPITWLGDGSRLLIAGESSAISGGGVVVLSPLTFVTPAGGSPTTPKTFSGPIFSVACDQSTNCYADLVDGRILRMSVAGDTTQIALPGDRHFTASDNGLFLVRPRIDSSGIERIDVTTKASVTFPGSSLTTILAVSPDGATAISTSGTAFSRIDVASGTTTSSSVPAHAGWIENSIIAAGYAGATPHLFVLTRWDSVDHTRFYEYDADANTELLLGETPSTLVSVQNSSWRPALHRLVASQQTQCLLAYAGQCESWQFDLLLLDAGTARRIARVTGETLYIATLSPDGKTAGYIARGLSGTFLFLKPVP